MNNEKVRVVKRDDATGELVRGSDGRCVQCGVDEPGYSFEFHLILSMQIKLILNKISELLFEIQSQGGVRNFDGYQVTDSDL